MRNIAAAAIAVLGLGAMPAQAQPAGEPVSDISTLVHANSWPGPDQLRGAGPAGSAEGWLTPADIPGAILASAEGKSAGPRFQITLAQVGIEVTVEADDSVSDCRGTYGQSDLAPQLCALIRERGRFRHALSVGGMPVRGVVQLTVQYSINGEGGNTGLPPAPMSFSRWPVLSYRDRVQIVTQPDWRRFSKVRDGRATAIELGFRSGVVDRCVVLRPSGDAALDRATCAAAKTGIYRLDPDSSYQSLPMIVRWRRDGAVANLPVRAESQRPGPANGQALVVTGVAGTAGASARVDLSVTGAVTRCWIATSAGSDAADIAMCRALTAARFDPARDVFDEPFESTYFAQVRFE
ncbi:hypothetical protein ACFQ1E_14905 [Sphingomonas canadensis]|uniref:TonB C-terminal domain-containing protein n=1 Tax=Sphingomonas canadensis TaxID=1219257 RepID=A0ABW3H8Y9_9SPHN|nr:hypothetical protein [Sphingomonas canadensis]MCW3837509.1 hypothetical protein [Sphingomonas canadensis]